MKDASFEVLEVTKVLHANEIHADSITFNDTSFKGNIYTSGSRIKELYESQRNTNAFTDDNAFFISSLKNNIKSKNDIMYHKIPFSKDISDDEIPEQSMVVCLNNSGQLIQKVKYNNIVTIYTFQQQKQSLSFDMIVDEDSGKVNVSIQD